MATTQKRSKLSPAMISKLKKASWSEWVKVFNEVHNSTMFTSIGIIKVTADDE